MIDFLEAMMILCWGVSWPISIRKSYVSRTAEGKSILFEVFIIVGYTCGIIRKFLQIGNGGSFNWIYYMGFGFYFINFIAVAIDMGLWFRNKHLDKKRAIQRVAGV